MITGVITSAHEKVRAYLKDGGIAVDATSGQGRDTVFLATHASHVYAFDIQEEAVDATRCVVDAAGLTSKVTCVCQSHAAMRDIVKEPVRVVVFNLGYLPGGDKTLTTRVESTLIALKQALIMLEVGGLLSVSVYPGHKEGKKEAHAIELFMASLPAKHYVVMKESMLNRHHAPYNVFVYKQSNPITH